MEHFRLFQNRYGNRLDVLPVLRTGGFSRRMSSFCLDSGNPLSHFNSIIRVVWENDGYFRLGTVSGSYEY